MSRGGRDDYDQQQYEDRGHQPRGRGGGNDSLRITVYQNGVEFDTGTAITLTRQQYKNWINFLEYLTNRLKLNSGAVHHLYDMEGIEMRHFRDLQNGERYVGATGRFTRCRYGQRSQPEWSKDNKIKTEPPPALDSTESLEIYLQNNQYRPTLNDMWDDTSFDLKRGGGGGGGRQGREGGNNRNQPSNGRARSADRNRNSPNQNYNNNNNRQQQQQGRQEPVRRTESQGAFRRSGGDDRPPKPNYKTVTHGNNNTTRTSNNVPKPEYATSRSVMSPRGYRKQDNQQPLSMTTTVGRPAPRNLGARPASEPTYSAAKHRNNEQWESMEQRHVSEPRIAENSNSQQKVGGQGATNKSQSQASTEEQKPAWANDLTDAIERLSSEVGQLREGGITIKDNNDQTSSRTTYAAKGYDRRDQSRLDSQERQLVD